jgi:DNA-binding CsgD family transcriptional regulator
LSGFIVLTPQFADSLLDAAVATKNRDAICVAINAVIDSRDSAATEKAILAAMKKYYKVTDEKDKRPSLKTILASMAAKYASKGDTARARKFLTAAMKDTIPGKEKVMTHLDDRCKKLTVSLLNEGQIASATKIYHHNLVACDSMRFTIGKKHLEDATKIRSSLANVLIIVVIVVAIICLVVYLVRAKQQDKEYVYESVTSRLQDSIDQYQQMLDDLQATNSDNKRETDMLRRQIDGIQAQLMERMQKGRVLYVSLSEGNPMPFDLKDADSYLIDYVMLFYPAKYRQWTEEYDKLTPRAFTYLILSDMGHSDAKIQEILSISASSVRSIKSRLNARRR